MRVSADAAEETGVWRERGIWAAAGLVHALFWISLQTRWLCPLFNDTIHRMGPGGDFFALYQAGYSALHGASIYRYHGLKVVIPYAYPYRYLPIDAYTIGVALTLVSPSMAYALWLGLIELCLIGNVRITYEKSGGGVRGALLGAAWLTFTPFFAELWVGQFTFLLGTLLFRSVLAVEEGRGLAGQGWWIGSVLWKPASLLWAPLWARERRYWAGLVLCGLLVGLNGIYFLFFPKDWPVFAQTNLDPLPQWHAGNLGLMALIYGFSGSVGRFHLIRQLVLVGVIVPVLWMTFAKPRRPFRLLASLWTLSYFLVYKDVWEHHFTMLLPFWVLMLWRSPSRWTVCWGLLLALPSPFVFYDPAWVGYRGDPQSLLPYGISLLHHSWRVVPVVALYGEWLRTAWGWTPEGTSSPTLLQSGEGSRSSGDRGGTSSLSLPREANSCVLKGSLSSGEWQRQNPPDRREFPVEEGAGV